MGRTQESLEHSGQRGKREGALYDPRSLCGKSLGRGSQQKREEGQLEQASDTHTHTHPARQSLGWAWSQGVSWGLDRFQEDSQSCQGQPLPAVRAEPGMGFGGDPKGSFFTPCSGQMSVLRLAQGPSTPGGSPGYGLCCKHAQACTHTCTRGHRPQLLESSLSDQQG